VPVLRRALKPSFVQHFETVFESVLLGGAERLRLKHNNNNDKPDLEAPQIGHHHHATTAVPPISAAATAIAALAKDVQTSYIGHPDPDSLPTGFPLLCGVAETLNEANLLAAAANHRPSVITLFTRVDLGPLLREIGQSVGRSAMPSIAIAISPARASIYYLAGGRGII